ncbi:hypothetical protein [Wolbachia endosymbiont of Mansonella perstans]|uniref:hypothetical protein n=1 Tax=Wolbachia endosymbiont of Mansonella perstans TaxID=229526 RepID=UPI001CE0FC74|nr:hypothetical protein [Wolbachia endosymbiont of Mansonella perstans]MCA4774563.1 hypothetical protein [Wolbachia endosymbiont of Mansonella perstans]
MKAFSKNLKSKEKKLEEFNEEIEDIAIVAQDKFAHELENITCDIMQKSHSLLTSVNSLKSSLVEYAVSSNFISKKGETALIPSLLNVVNIR